VTSFLYVWHHIIHLHPCSFLLTYKIWKLYNKKNFDLVVKGQGHSDLIHIYPNNFFKCALPNLKSWICPCIICFRTWECGDCDLDRWPQGKQIAFFFFLSFLLTYKIWKLYNKKNFDLVVKGQGHSDLIHIICDTPSCPYTYIQNMKALDLSVLKQQYMYKCSSIFFLFNSLYVKLNTDRVGYYCVSFAHSNMYL
jgi:hypothetical protein